MIQRNVRSSTIAVVALVSLTIASSGASDQTCTTHWMFDAFPTGGLNHSAQALATLPVGDGPPLLIVGGEFTQAGGTPAQRIASWDGAQWSPLGAGVNGILRDLCLCQVGDGEPVLFAAGEFTHSGGTEVSYIAQWDGQQWIPVGDGFNDIVLSLACIEEPDLFPDDDASAILVAGGRFTASGQQPIAHIARWDGDAWQQIGTGLVKSGTAIVNAIIAGSVGEQSPTRLYVVGTFTHAGDVQVNRIAQWDGSQWQPLAGGLSSEARTLALFDTADSTLLVVGGEFISTSPASSSYIAAWNGDTWVSVNSPANNRVNSLLTHDDGAGMRLYAGGRFTTFNGGMHWHLTTWDGQTWSPLYKGVDAEVNVMLSVNDDNGPGLIIGGIFTNTFPVTVERIARWQRDGLPLITQHPSNTQAQAGDPVSLEVLVKDDAGVNYQWMRDGVPLEDEPGGRINGADNATLMIQPVQADDAGTYAALVMNECGTVESYAATLEVIDTPPSPDLNGDGVVNLQDLIILINAWGGCPDPSPGNCPADLNGDGAVNLQDLIILINAWGPV